MDELIKYFNLIGADFVEEKSKINNDEIPKIMRDFFDRVRRVDLPYGRIYNVEQAINNSKNEPFCPDWFVFGQDNYSSFWLCAKKESDDGCNFTYWDHESGLKIDEPAWTDLLSFLKEVEEDSNGEW